MLPIETATKPHFHKASSIWHHICLVFFPQNGTVLNFTQLVPGLHRSISLPILLIQRLATTLVSPGFIHDFQLSKCPKSHTQAAPSCPSNQGPSPHHRIRITPCTRKSAFVCVDADNYLTSCFWPALHVSFLNYIIVFLSDLWFLKFYLPSACVSSWEQNGVQFTIWSALNCLFLAGF